MANTDILTLTPEFGLTESIEFRTDITESESGKEHRDALWDAGLRAYKLTCKFLTKATMDVIWDFYIARKGMYDHFLVKILTEYEASAENVGEADNATTRFTLHHFPVDTSANHSCTVNGVANTDYVLTNDFTAEKSYIDFNTAPETGTILVTYEFYYKVRFGEDKLTRELAAYQLLHAGMILQEVRWTSFVPPNANSSSSSSSSSSRSSSSSSSSFSSSSSSSSST
jgi:uncharacterized protein (TIGR02217 family)